MRYSTVLATSLMSLLSAVAFGQSTPRLTTVGLKYGLSLGNEPGAYFGADYRPLKKAPIRLDADAWSAFREFGDRSAGLSFTVNYVKRFSTSYAGAGIGYARVRERGDDFDSVAVKYFIGVRLPGTAANLEGGAIWTQHASGSGHTIGYFGLVWKL